jgi:replicative DNA helicase
MRAREVFNRKLSLLTGIDLAKLSKAEVNQTELEKIAFARTNMFQDSTDLYEKFLEHKDYSKFEKELITTRELNKENQMIIIDNQRLTLANIDLTVHKYKTQFEDKLKLVVVDYINQIDMEDKYDWKNQIKMSGKLKEIARKHDIILVTPYQIDSTGEARFSKGILDSMDIAMILEREEGSGRIDFKSTKTRNKARFEFASPLEESTMRIDPNDYKLPPKDVPESDENKEKDKDLPW